MSKKTAAMVHIVYGPQGAGKSTYARQLATRLTGVRFSIDDWMAELFGPDLPKPMNLSWVMEREFEAPSCSELADSLVVDTCERFPRITPAGVRQRLDHGLHQGLHHLQRRHHLRRKLLGRFH